MSNVTEKYYFRNTFPKLYDRNPILPVGSKGGLANYTNGHNHTNYHTRMREGNVFILSVWLSTRAITFECLNIETFLVWWYILTKNLGLV